MRQVFDYPVTGRQAMSQLLDMQQGSLSVLEYALNFRILAAESGWGILLFRPFFARGWQGTNWPFGRNVTHSTPPY